MGHEYIELADRLSVAKIGIDRFLKTYEISHKFTRDNFSHSHEHHQFEKQAMRNDILLNRRTSDSKTVQMIKDMYPHINFDERITCEERRYPTPVKQGD